MTETERATRLRSWTATFGAVVGVELRRWARQPIALASTFLLPVAIAAITSVALGDDPDITTMLAVVDHEHGPTSEAFISDALGHPAVEAVIEAQEVDTERTADQLLADDEVDVVVVLPANLSERLAESNDAGIDVRADNPLAGNLTSMVVDQFVTRARAAAVALARAGALPATEWPIEVRVTAAGGRRLDAATHYGPGVGMFFVLATLGFTTHAFVNDRRREMIDRLGASPQAMSAVLVGRSAAALAVGGLSLATTAAAMQLLFGRSWGPPGAVAVMVVAVAVAMTGVAAVLAVLSRTPEQAQTLTAAVAFVFALLSGTFSPPGSITTRPSFAELVPTTHALDGFAVLATEGTGLGSVGEPIGVLVVMGLAGLVASGMLSRRLL